MKWNDILPENIKILGNRLAAQAQEERDRGITIYPPQDKIFRALELTPPDKVKVCLVGQDPYHGPGQANGLAFSVHPGIPLPPSLKNIYKELVADTGCPMPTSGDLTPWAEQGVLMLNTVLTVQDGVANSHKNWGWQEFTQAVFAACASLPQPIVFLTWGGQARAFLAGIPISQLPNKAAVFSSHPSPLGATKGSDTVPAFIGSRPFSATNHYLTQMGSSPINWTLF